jgi:23S rRNA pseudouridine2605 synthase
LLRAGTRDAWLEVVRSEVKNRRIRRLPGAVGADVLRPVRADVGGVRMRDRPKGVAWHLAPAEKVMLDVPARAYGFAMRFSEGSGVWLLATAFPSGLGFPRTGWSRPA